MCPDRYVFLYVKLFFMFGAKQRPELKAEFSTSGQRSYVGVPLKPQDLDVALKRLCVSVKGSQVKLSVNKNLCHFRFAKVLGYLVTWSLDPDWSGDVDSDIVIVSMVTAQVQVVIKKKKKKEKVCLY